MFFRYENNLRFWTPCINTQIYLNYILYNIETHTLQSAVWSTALKIFNTAFLKYFFYNKMSIPTK